VVELGEGVDKVEIGDLVACAGGGYANHADEVVVPANLVARVPEGVTAEAAAMTTLGAIALQGIRLAQPTLGETAVVSGLGVVGLMACQLLKANGCRVFGIDVDPSAIDRARQLAALDAVAQLNVDPTEGQVQEFSRGLGADLVIICAGTKSSEPVELAGKLVRKRGRVVVVGAVGMDIPREDYYRKEIRFAVSCSYGPGRYDPNYEELGQDYPPGFVRWTEGRNMEAVLDLMAAGKFEPLGLVTHRIPFEDAPSAYEMIAEGSDPYCGLLLTYPDAAITPQSKISLVHSRTRDGNKIGVGFVGAGSFAQTFLLPPLRSHKRVQLTGIATRSGLGAADVGKRFGFSTAVSSPEDIFKDDGTDAVVIATRHDQHGPGTIAALDAGKHVFVEKPLCLSEEELEQIAIKAGELSASNSMPVLQVGYNRRFSQAAQIAKTHFGRPSHASHAGGPLCMFYRVNAGHIPRDHWTQDPIEGGGRILGEVCHFVDLMQFMSGSDPVLVSAMCVDTNNTNVVHEDNVVINLRFADGSVGSIGYFGEGSKTMPKEQLEIVGLGRSATIVNFQKVILYSERRKAEKRCSGKGHSEEINAFLQGVENGNLPIPMESLLATSLTTFAIRRSLTSGRAETIATSKLLTTP
jgi:polar amino acid transport system substrate-binding protein